MENLQKDRQSRAWPFWMLRYIASDDREALNDLIWSVGDSPPYGNVSYEEATAVYNLIEQYMGPGMASVDAYDAVQKHIRSKPERMQALALFRIRDRIASNPDNINAEDVSAGQVLADQIGHTGVRAYFANLQAMLHYEVRNIPAAKTSFLHSLSHFLTLLSQDRAYTERVVTSFQNAINLCVMDGDFAKARELVGEADAQLPRSVTQQWHALVGEIPTFSRDLSAILDRAGDYLNAGELVVTLQWYQEAERLARASQDEGALCGLLGDMAFIFNRLDNPERAIETYYEAITLSEKRHDWENLSRWHQNLGVIFRNRQDAELAGSHFRRALNAALESQLPYQISTALGNYAGYLADAKRFAEAIESVDRAMATLPDDPKLHPIWRKHRVFINARWGDQLYEEGQIITALETYANVMREADHTDEDQLRTAAITAAKMGALYEARNDIAGAISFSEQAIGLFRALGDDEAADRMDSVVSAFRTKDRVTQTPTVTRDDVEILQHEVAQAVAAGDREAEATARVNLASFLLQADDSQATAAFDDALTLVRALQDRRRELILCLNFTSYFLDSGQVLRALNLAQRSVELITDDRPDYKIIAYLTLGQVFADGLGESARAAAAYQVAIATLKSYRQANPEAASALITNVSSLLAKASRAALDAGETEAALEIMEFIEPGLGEDIRQKHQAMRDRLSNTIDVEALRALSDPALDPLLAAWRASAIGVPHEEPVQNRMIERIRQFVAVLDWPDADARLARVSIPAAHTGASLNGPAGALRLVVHMVNHEVSHEAAERAVRALTLSDDDLLCICLYAVQDQAMASSGAAFHLLELAAQTVSNPVLTGRLYNVLGIFTNGDPERQLSYYQRGTEALRGGEDERLRAHLLNEMAVSMLALGRFEQSIDVARQAKALAEAVGAMQYAAMATGNIGNSLMNLNRWDEALSTFESLAALQESIGDKAGLEITRHNLNTCFIRLGRKEQVIVDEASTDPDSLFNQAAYLGLEGEYERSITLFTRGFEMVERDGRPYPHEGHVRGNYARILYSAGRHDEAIEQMRATAKWHEQHGNIDQLHDAYAWLAGVALHNRTVRLYYAERAVALGRQVAQPSALAVDLGHLAQVHLAEGKPDEAIALLQEALQLTDHAGMQMSLAHALVSARRFDEAMQIYDDLYSKAVSDGDIRVQIKALLGRADVYYERLDNEKAITIFRDARTLAKTLPPAEEHVQAANQLGLALLRNNALTEAAQCFEEGIDLARTLGLTGHELSLLNNLSHTLMETGDLDGAEATLMQVRERSQESGEKDHELKAVGTLANVLARKGSYEQALRLYGETEAIASEIGNREIEAVALDSIGTTLSALGQPARSIEYHRRAARMHEQLGLWDAQTTDLLNLVGAYLAIEEPQQAETVLETAADTVAAHNLMRLEVMVQRLRGEIALQTHRWDAAKEHFQVAICHLEAIRGMLRTPAQARQWAEDKTAIYSRAAEAAILAGDGEAAIACVEANKTRFLRALSQRRMQRPAGVDEAIWLRYQQVADRQAELQARRWASLATPDAELEVALQQARVAYTQVRSIVDASMTYDDARTVVLTGIHELVQELPAGAVAVSIDVYPSGLGVVSAGRTQDGSLYSRTRMVDTFTRDDLANLLVGDREGLRQAVETGQVASFPAQAVGWMRGSYVYGQNPDWIDAMSRVYGAEIRGVSQLWPSTISAVCHILGNSVWPAILETLPADTHRLILMPSAGFALLPLHAAILADGTPVDRRFFISYVPSLGILHQIGQHDTLPVEMRLGQVINPTQDLLFSELEAVEFARSFRGVHEQVLGSDACIGNVLSLLSKTDIFHFTGHAFYDQQDPFSSGLVCASEDGHSSTLTLRTVLEQLTTIHSKFVILAACETAQVEARDVLNDFLGLPGGFIVAGANAVLASLWRVEDLATALLIGKFSQLWNVETDLRNGVAALADAQDWLRTVTAGDLAARFEAERCNPKDERQFSYEQASEAWQRFTYDFDVSDRPFEEPIYWAGFTFTGV